MTSLRKEIRLLLPFFGIALFLAVVPSWIVAGESFASSAQETVFWVFGFGLVLLGLAPFGQEFGLGTFSSLLAQPAQRNRIWMTKLLLILAATLLVLLALIVSIHLRFDALLKTVAQRIEEDTRANYVWDLNFQKSLLKNLHSHAFWWIGIAAAAVGVSGGLWASLLFRQIGAALWFSLLVPAVFFICIEWFVPDDFAREIVLLVGAAAYSIAGVFWAHRLFLQAQDVQWLGDSISPFSLRSANAQAASLGLRRLRPLPALVLKEIQSHQISYLVAFGLLVLHLSTLAIRRFYTFPNNSQLRFAVESVPFLWFMLPWLIGCVAVAEERKLGIVESQFCVPVSRRSQFVVKFTIVLVLGVVLGALMPCLLEAGGSLLGISSGLAKPPFFFGLNEFFSFARGAAVVAATLAGISFFASTLTRNTLHALGAGVVLTGVFWALFQWVETESQNGWGYSLWRGSLILRIGIPVLILVPLWLSWSNYKRLHVNGNVWLRNALILGASLFLVGTGTAVIYQRPWELLTSFEPKQGPARLSGPVRPALCTSYERTLALLPDGRLWAGMNYHWDELAHFQYWDSLYHSNVIYEVRTAVPDGGQFVGGSNWVSVAAIPGEVVALQSDGSLWRILSRRDLREDKTNRFNWNRWFSLMPAPRRIGTDNDWISVVAARSQNQFVMLKADGTVWHWGYIWKNSDSFVEQSVRFGTNSDWGAIFSQGYDVLFMKRDGEVWTTRYEDKDLHKLNLNGSDWLAVSSSLYLHKDGSLWASGFLPRVVFGTRPSSIAMHRIGHDSDWQQIAAGLGTPVAIKSGKLVESDTALFSATLGQPSRRSDWLAVDTDQENLLAVAADGTISCWFPREATGGSLGPTRRPLWTLNVLDDTQ